LDLVGATIGVPARGSAAETFISAMLVDAGLDPAQDVTFVATGLVATSVAAMKAGQVDALPGIASTRVQYPALGLDVYIVASIADETAGRFGKTYLNSIAFTTPEIADERDDDISAWCAAMAETISWMQDEANEQRLDELAAEWLMLPDAATAADAINPTLDQHLAHVSEARWHAQFELFPQLTPVSYDDVVFTPCAG
jgi:ABC-type nitrate/sulfonate/bicarbonate transport system substrate-binding protein